MSSYQFGTKLIPICHTFYKSTLSYALVNLKPIVPGHVMVCPDRVVKRFNDLLPEEISDLFITAQKVSKVVECYYKCTSFTIAIQDGEQAGQTVPHVHVHIIPRVAGDFLNNDQIYVELQKHDKEDFGITREARSFEVMKLEAEELKKCFNES